MFSRPAKLMKVGKKVKQLHRNRKRTRDMTDVILMVGDSNSSDEKENDVVAEERTIGHVISIRFAVLNRYWSR